MDLKEKTFLITGGASGLGAACVRRFTNAGAHVVILDRNLDPAQIMMRDLPPDARARTRFVSTDVTRAEDVQLAIDTAWAEFGCLHGAVNCAGIGTPAKLVDKDGKPHSADLFARIIQINLLGTFNVLRLAAASMIRQEIRPGTERGVIINTASVAAFDGQIGQVAYSASKGAIVAMTLPSARELARFGIRVMTIAPGIFDTPMLAGLPEEARLSLGQQVPFPPRLGKPDEYALLAQNIIENEMLNGEVIRLDGAIRMAPK